MEEWKTITSRKKEKVRRLVLDKDGQPITKNIALSLQRSLDIIGFADAILSNEASDLCLQGWKYLKVSKGNEEKGKGDEDTDNAMIEYISINVRNKYGDRLIFSRQRRM